MPRERRPSIYGREEPSGKGGLIAVVLVLIMIGGVGFALMQGDGPDVGAAENLLAQSRLAASEITKESFVFSGSLEAGMPGSHFIIPVSGNGMIDSENSRMYFKVNIEPPEGIGEGGDTLVIESYTIGDTIYSLFAGSWAKQQTGEQIWGEAHFSQKLLSLAGNFDVGKVEKEEVDGKEAFKILITPTAGELMELMAVMDPGILERMGADIDTGGQSIRSIEMELWIDAESYLPKKAEFSLIADTTVLNPAGSGVVSVEMKITASISLNYNTQFNIVLPSAASSAIEL
jgi:hypothetical protein